MNARAHIENMNYWRDSRVCDRRAAPVVYDDDGNAIPLACKWAICDVCAGNGKHVNPSIDCGGLDEESLRDDEFMEGYMSGAYDVACNACGGSGKVEVVDEARVPPELLAAYERAERENAECEAESRAERMMGA